MKCWSFILLIVLVMSLVLPVSADSVTGYYKIFFTGFQLPTLDLADSTDYEPPIGSVANRVRLKFTAHPTSWLSFHGAYDFSPRVQDVKLFQQDVLNGSLESGGYRVSDFHERLYPVESKSVSSFAVFHNLDRFYLTVKTSFADIFIGRQAIAWGSAKFINPTDVVAPFTFTQLDTEERRGVDALRVRVPLGMMAEVDLGWIAGRDFNFADSAFFMKGKFSWFKTDVTLLMMGFRRNLLLGIDLARSIGGAGAWCEAAWVKPGFFSKAELETGIEDGAYFRASVGMDYNFSSNLYGFFEYHFNSPGKRDLRAYNDVSVAYVDGSTYLRGRHYLNLGLTTQITPLMPLNGMVIWNLSDGSFTLSPTLEYNIAQNIYLGLGAYIGIGKSPEFVKQTIPGSPNFQYRSEFGAYPDMVYTSFRYYF